MKTNEYAAALAWALEQIEDSLDPDHQEALEHAWELVRAAQEGTPHHDAQKVLADARDAWLDGRLDDLGGILCGDVCEDAINPENKYLTNKDRMLFWDEIVDYFGLDSSFEYTDSDISEYISDYWNSLKSNQKDTPANGFKSARECALDEQSAMDREYDDQFGI